MARTLRRDPGVRRAVPVARRRAGALRGDLGLAGRAQRRGVRRRGARGVRRPRRGARGGLRRRGGALLVHRGHRRPQGGRRARPLPRRGPRGWLDRAGAGHRRRRGGPVGRRRLRADDRAAPARRPADERARWLPHGATSAAALDTVEETVDLTGIGAVVGLAGTITTITAHALCLPEYQPDAIHLAQVPVAAHRAACESLLTMGHAERAALAYLHPGRVDVIAGGALVWAGRARAGAAALLGGARGDLGARHPRRHRPLPHLNPRPALGAQVAAGATT